MDISITCLYKTIMKDLFAELKCNTPPHIYLCEPDWSWQVQSMPDHDLWCVLSGQGELRLDEETHALSPGSCWLFAPGMSIDAKHDPLHRLRVFSIHFSLLDTEGKMRSLAEDECPNCGVLIHDVFHLEQLALGGIAGFQAGDDLGQMQLQLYVRQMLLMLLAASRPRENVLPRDECMENVWRQISEDPGRDWSVDKMAAMAYLSKPQFSRRFKEANGQSPMQSVLTARMTRACHLLHETTHQVGEIADMLGYSDMYHFSRHFKTVNGVSPTVFRRQAFVESHDRV